MTPEQEHQLDAWLALSGQTPPPTNPVRLPMLSGSMAPTIPVGAGLEILVKPGCSCRAGDVVVFQDNDKLIAHRILLVVQFGPRRWLLEKGDANPAGRWRPGTAVRGWVVGVIANPAAPGGNPADLNLARLGLRRHFRHWLLTLGGLLSTHSSEK